jgi:transcriptional regulator with XRE-family HTH domain
MIGTPSSRLSAYETGKAGLGKGMIMRICKALDVEPYEFFIDESTPICRDDFEKISLLRLRQAREMGLAAKIDSFITFTLTEARLNEVERETAQGQNHKELGNNVK